MIIKHYKVPFALSFGLIVLYSMLILLMHKDVIALYYNFGLQPDRFGSKYELFEMALVNSAIATTCMYLSGKPHLLNYPIEITAQTKEMAFANMKLFLSYISLTVTVVFALITLYSAL